MISNLTFFFQIVGMDAFATHTFQKKELLLRSHLRALRSNPFFADAWLIIIYEKNTGLSAGHGWSIACEYQPAYAIFQRNMDSDKAMDTDDQDPGIVTSYYLKNEYARVLGEGLRNQNIYFHKDWVCANPFINPLEARRAMVFTEYIKQLSNCRTKRPSMDPNRVQLGANIPRITWSGKIGPDGREVRGQNDDTCFASAQCMYWINRIYQWDFPGFPYHKIFPNLESRRVNRTKH
jgi:hypothetical protein